MARTPPLGSHPSPGPGPSGNDAPASSHAIPAPLSGSAPILATVPDGTHTAPARTSPAIGAHTWVQGIAGLPPPPSQQGGTAPPPIAPRAGFGQPASHGSGSFPAAGYPSAAQVALAQNPTVLGNAKPRNELLSAPHISNSETSPRASLTSGSGVLPKLCPVCSLRYPVEFNVCPKDAAELVDAEEDDDELIGRVLADTYSIIRVVGEGGMGRVYEARHTRIGGKRFAVKLLHPEYARLPEVLSRFQREAEAAASIESPHVGDVYDIGKTDDGRPFMVGEFLEGRELAEFVRERGRLEVQPAVRIVRQICKALAAAHAKGIVHRDMKPENVFLTGDLASPTSKVIDFGISKVKEAGGGPSLTKTGMIMGTPSYMAPEQAKGEHVDHRVDIYAAGAILYELVTGKRPFDRSDPTATIMAVLLEEPERPRTLNPSLPEGLEMVIQRAMAKAADARYQTMDELEHELSSFAERSGPVGASMMPPSKSQPGAPSPGSRAVMEARERDVALSRPTIALLGSLSVFGVLAGLMTMAAAFIRLGRGPGANVTGSESLLLGLLLALALATPIAFAVHFVRKNVWNNSAKTIELANVMKRSVVAAFVTYGLVSVTIRLTEGLLLRRAAGVAWPVWDILALALALAAGVLSHFALRESKR
jgi:serine/threonine protein kinase